MKIQKLILAFIFLVIANKAQSQIELTNLGELSKVKNGTTYIAMKDPEDQNSLEFVEIFKKYWTISKIQFIKYTEIDKYISPQSSFLTMGGYVTTVETSKLYQNGTRKSGIDYSHTHLYLELWTCSDKFFASTKKDKEFKDKHKIQVARVELFTDFLTLNNPDNIFQTAYDGEGHIRNWGTGFLKNYIQVLTSLVNENKVHGLYQEFLNEKEIKKVKSQTLLIPDYVLIKFNKFSGDESKKHEEKEILGGYKSNYQLISTDELNKKILNDKTGFLYLVYVKSSTDKFISIVNSLTGEVIYSKYSPMSYNMNEGDIKELQKAIGK